MIRIERRLPARVDFAQRRLTLPYAERCKSRLRVHLDNDEEAGLFLPRGTVLRGGDQLQADDGRVIELLAAAEALYRVQAAPDSKDPHFDLLRAAYHLGNRHVPVQLQPGVLVLERDGVLRELLLRLGLRVSEAIAPFEPEAGAYGGGHRHDHDVSGGMLGEQLSRLAHGDSAPDFSGQQFHLLR